MRNTQTTFLWHEVLACQLQFVQQRNANERKMVWQESIWWGSWEKTDFSSNPSSRLYNPFIHLVICDPASFFKASGPLCVRQQTELCRQPKRHRSLLFTTRGLSYRISRPRLLCQYATATSHAQSDGLHGFILGGNAIWSAGLSNPPQQESNVSYVPLNWSRESMGMLLLLLSPQEGGLAQAPNL